VTTRLYLHSSASPISGLPSNEQSTLTTSDSFEVTQSANRIMTTTIGTSQTSLSNISAPTQNPTNYYVGRWVSPALHQTTSISANTWTLNFAAAQSDANANFPVSGNSKALYVNAYVWRPSTSLRVGTIRDGVTNTSYDEPSAPSTEKCMHGTFAGSAVSGVQDGDVLIVEMWAQVQQGADTSYSQTVYFDGTSVTTTPNATVSNHASFLETPQDLIFATRLYLRALVNPLPDLPTTPSLGGYISFEGVSEFPHRLMSTAKGSSQKGMVHRSLATLSPVDYMIGRWVSPPLKDVTAISGHKWTLNFAAMQSHASAHFPVTGSNQAFYINVFVWRPRTQAIVGTICPSGTDVGYDEPTATSVRSMHGMFTGSSVAGVQDGDVIVLEMIPRVTQAAASEYFQSIYFDGGTVTLTENTVVSDHASFLETPQSLTFGPLTSNASVPVLDVTKAPYYATADIAGGGDVIQAAIDAFIDNPLQWHAIYIPPGTYKLSRPLVVGRSGQFTRVVLFGSHRGVFPAPGYPLSQTIIEWRDGSTASKTQPLLIIQGARRSTIEGIHFRAANTAPQTLSDQGSAALFQYEYADWIAAGVRDNPHSPQCAVAIDPFIPDYPRGDPANRYPGLEGFYGGPQMAQPLGSSAVEFIGCGFEGGAFGVVVSPPGGAAGASVDSGAGCSSADGFQVTLSGDSFDPAIAPGQVFNLTSGAFAGQGRVIQALVDSTHLTLQGSGFSAAFGAATWEVRAPGVAAQAPVDLGGGASSGDGVSVALSGDSFGPGVSAGQMFTLKGGPFNGQGRVILSVADSTHLTLEGSGFGSSFASTAWEVRPLFDLVQNAESFEFNCCYWHYNRVHYSQGQSQSRANRITSPRMVGSFIAIDDQLLAPSGNPGVNPFIDGTPNIGQTRFVFNLGLATQTFHLSNMYCEAIASLGRLGTGLSGTMAGAILTACSVTFYDQKVYAPSHPDVPYNLDAWGIVQLIGCQFSFAAFSGLLRVSNPAGRLVLDGCKIFQADSPSGYVPAGFHSRDSELETRLLHLYNSSLGPVFQNDPKGAGKFSSLSVNGGGNVTVLVGANSSEGTVALANTTGLNVGDVISLAASSPTAYAPERFPASLAAYNYTGPVGQIRSIVPNTSITIDRLPKGFPFSVPVKLDVLRWAATP
jgi:hypothetical protein